MALSTELQDFLWDGRDEPYYAVHRTTIRSPLPMPKRKAIQALARGERYFSPVPRIAKGHQKTDCSPSFNVLWCDIDMHEGITADEAAGEVADRLAAIDPLFPSVIVYSGNRGVHLYWKLDSDLPGHEVEARNKQLIRLLDGDHCFELNRLLRNPGTTNEKSGRHCEIIDFDGRVSSISDLNVLGPLDPSPVRRASAASTDAPTNKDGERARKAQELGGWREPDFLNLQRLKAIYKAYMTLLPPKGWTSKKYLTRSEIEQAIVYVLVGKGFGASDDQIIGVADEYFAKHRYESAMTGDRYITRTINRARQLHFENGWVTSDLGGWPRKADAKYRQAMPEDYAAAVELAHGQPKKAWIEEVGAEFSQATAYRIWGALIAEGLIRIDGGSVYRTDE